MRIKKLLAAVLAAVLTSAALLSTASAADLRAAEVRAKSLKKLGLFLGTSDTEFDLDREPTRVEALVMLIRALGKESDAKNGSFTHPFTDVPSWANAYVGYAYQNGLTNGVSATSFGTSNADAAMYLTFMLRALGYSDKDGDFVWNDPFTLARETGILTDRVDVVRFLRADVVEVSYAALEAKMKDSEVTLSRRLVQTGVFTEEEYNTAKNGKDAPAHITDGAEIPEIFILPVQPPDPLEDMNNPAIGD